jgi:tetratricopeptide (TPR) repeat protein
VEERRLPAGDPGVALTLANLAETLSRQGRPGEAVPLLERALAIRVERLGDARAETAQTRHELAVALASTAGAGDGELARAQALLEESLAARERLSPGPASPEVAATLADLAEVLRRRGQPDAALPHLARVLAIHESAARDGVGGRDLAAILNNLALLHYRRGAYLDAEPLLARAVLVESQALGPDHPDLAVTLENHAAVLLELERREEAEAALHRAKAVRIANAPAQTPPAQAR